MTNSAAVVQSSNRGQQERAVSGVLAVRVLGAKNLQSSEYFGDVDSYVTVTYGGESFSTEVTRGNNRPEYGEEFLWTSGLRAEDAVWITVFEKFDTVNYDDQELGRTVVPLCALTHGYLEPTYFELEKDGAAAGELCVSVRFTNLSTNLDLSVSSGANSLTASRSHDRLSALDGQQGGEYDDSDVIEQAAAYLSGPRIRFLRYGYYYDLSKQVYRKARTLPILNLTVPAYEYMMGGVITVAMGPWRNPAQRPGDVIDHLVTGALSRVDDVIDETKDRAIRTAVQLKNKVMHFSESLAASDEEAEGGRPEALGGKVAAIKGYLRWGATVAKPVVGSLPIVGGVLRKTIDRFVPTNQQQAAVAAPDKEAAGMVPPN